METPSLNATATGPDTFDLELVVPCRALKGKEAVSFTVNMRSLHDLTTLAYAADAIVLHTPWIIMGDFMKRAYHAEVPPTEHSWKIVPLIFNGKRSNLETALTELFGHETDPAVQTIQLLALLGDPKEFCENMGWYEPWMQFVAEEQLKETGGLN